MEMSLQHITHQEEEARKSSDKSQAEVLRKQTELDTLRQNLLMVEQDRDEASRKNQNKTSTLQHTTHELSVLQETLRERNSAFTVLEEKHRGVETLASRLESELKKEKREHQELTEEMTRKSRTSRQENELLNTEMESVRVDLKMCQEKYQTLEEDTRERKVTQDRLTTQKDRQHTQLQKNCEKMMEEVDRVTVLCSEKEEDLRLLKERVEKYKKESTTVKEENVNMKRLLSMTQDQLQEVELVLKDTTIMKSQLKETKERNRTLESQITRASLEISSLTQQLEKTMEESSYHESKGMALTNAEMRIQELSLVLTKTQGSTSHISKESDWLKSENSAMVRTLQASTDENRRLKKNMQEMTAHQKHLKDSVRRIEEEQQTQERIREREQMEERNTNLLKHTQLLHLHEQEKLTCQAEIKVRIGMQK